MQPNSVLCAHAHKNAKALEPHQAKVYRQQDGFEHSNGTLLPVYALLPSGALRFL
jgi:hypothetical protein